jgi:hypothetical protein
MVLAEEELHGSSVYLRLRASRLRWPRCRHQSEDLTNEWPAVAELRSMKVEEIRDLLSISPAASVEEVLRIVKWWQDSHDGSFPTKLKSQAHRLLSEIHSLNEANLKILDELRNHGIVAEVQI